MIYSILNSLLRDKDDPIVGLDFTIIHEFSSTVQDHTSATKDKWLQQ